MLKLNNKIYIIANPMGAITLAIMAEKAVVDICIVEIYKGYTDTYKKTIRKLLNRIQIRNLYFLELFYYEIEKDYKKRKDMMKANEKLIKSFNQEFLCGRLYDKSNEFISEACSHILSYSKVELDNIKIIEHSPIDSMHRIAGEGLGHKVEENIIYPHRYQLYLHPRGFTFYRFENHTYELLDYRKYKHGEQFLSGRVLDYSRAAVLLASQGDEFMEIDETPKSMRNLDFIQLHIGLVCQHIKKSEFVIVKFHPHVYNILPKEEIKNCESRILDGLMKNGYRGCLFRDLLKQDSIIGMPLEIFTECLKIKKVVGIMSSIFWVLSTWNDVEGIADCRGIPFLQNIMIKRKSILPANFKLYTD